MNGELGNGWENEHRPESEVFTGRCGVIVLMNLQEKARLFP
jgi:hypothetical protein